MRFSTILLGALASFAVAAPVENVETNLEDAADSDKAEPVFPAIGLGAAALGAGALGAGAIGATALGAGALGAGALGVGAGALGAAAYRGTRGPNVVYVQAPPPRAAPYYAAPQPYYAQPPPGYYPPNRPYRSYRW